jgi:hypothetical protein
VGSQLHTPAPLPPLKNTFTHWIRSWEGPRAHLERFGEEKNLMSLYQDSKFPAWTLRSPVTIPTTRGVLKLKTYVGRTQILKMGAWLHVIISSKRVLCFGLNVNTPLKRSHTFKSKTAVYSTWLISKVTLLLCCLFTAAGYRANRAKLFEPLWLMTQDIFGSLNLKKFLTLCPATSYDCVVWVPEGIPIHDWTGPGASAVWVLQDLFKIGTWK